MKTVKNYKEESIGTIYGHEVFVRVREEADTILINSWLKKAQESLLETRPWSDSPYTSKILYEKPKETLKVSDWSQTYKIAIMITFGLYFIYWSNEVLNILNQILAK